MTYSGSPIRRRSDCRLCNSFSLKCVLKLRPSPPANAFVCAQDKDKAQATFPLDLHLCRQCGHVQLLDVVDPEILFTNYVYVSGTSPVFVEHFRQYARDLMTRYNQPSGGRVVEIGSNDGTLLSFFKKSGMVVLGVDPAKDIARTANDKGLPTLAGFFDYSLAEQIINDGAADLVLANNVFAHADDLKDMLKGVELLLRPQGIFAFEVSYLVDIYQKTLFDTIYHEHLSYHTVSPLVPFLDRSGLTVIDAVRVPTHGGSIRVIAQKKKHAGPIRESVASLMQLEQKLQLDKPETFESFGEKITQVKRSLKGKLSGWVKEGKRIAGFGAPAKATTLMHHFELGGDILDFLVDDNPLKQGLYSPGFHVPVLNSEAIYQKNPDILLVLAWNFADSIMKRHAAFAQKGGRFIIPLPEVTIHPNS